MERLSILISSDLSRRVSKAAEEGEQTKSELFRDALKMFLAARDGAKSGLKVGLVDPETSKLATEFLLI